MPTPIYPALTAPPMQRICGWCQALMADGTLPATHGICDACQTKCLNRLFAHDPRD